MLCVYTDEHSSCHTSCSMTIDKWQSETFPGDLNSWVKQKNSLIIQKWITLLFHVYMIEQLMTFYYNVARLLEISSAILDDIITHSGHSEVIRTQTARETWQHAYLVIAAQGEKNNMNSWDPAMPGEYESVNWWSAIRCYYNL